MADPERRKQYRVTVTLDGKHPKHRDYPLLPGDIVVWQGIRDGWCKVAPGLGIFGFELTTEDFATLETADDARWVIA